MATFDAGYYLVKEDVKVDFGGAWSITFRAGQILNYTSDKKMLKWDIETSKWKNIVPPIQGETNLDLDQYGRLYERQEILNKFYKNVKILTKKKAEELASQQTVDVDDLLKKAGIKVVDGRVLKSDIPKIIKIIKGL